MFIKYANKIQIHPSVRNESLMFINSCIQIRQTADINQKSKYVPKTTSLFVVKMNTTKKSPLLKSFKILELSAVSIMREHVYLHDSSKKWPDYFKYYIVKIPRIL